MVEEKLISGQFPKGEVFNLIGRRRFGMLFFPQLHHPIHLWQYGTQTYRLSDTASIGWVGSVGSNKID